MIEQNQKAKLMTNKYICNIPDTKQKVVLINETEYILENGKEYDLMIAGAFPEYFSDLTEDFLLEDISDEVCIEIEEE